MAPAIFGHHLGLLRLLKHVCPLSNRNNNSMTGNTWHTMQVYNNYVKCIGTWWLMNRYLIPAIFGHDWHSCLIQQEVFGGEYMSILWRMRSPETTQTCRLPPKLQLHHNRKYLRQNTGVQQIMWNQLKYCISLSIINTSCRLSLFAPICHYNVMLTIFTIPYSSTCSDTQQIQL